MPRMSRLFLAATLSTLAALLPVTVFAADSPSLTVFVVGAQYAVGNPDWCVGGTTSSFAGLGSVIPGGQGAVFQTTICHTGITHLGGATILAGGSFRLATSTQVRSGEYRTGTVSAGEVKGNHFCREVFVVEAFFAPSGNITGGGAKGTLTHYGVRNGDECHAYAASISGTATVTYN